MFDLSGRVALVTGAGQGVGTGIARALATAGAAVAVNDLHADRAATTTRTLTEFGAQAVAVAFDITDPDAVDEGVDEVTGGLGPVDILVNNAGVPETMNLVPFLEMRPDEWSAYVALNLYGSMHCIRAVAPGMRERGWGRILQISSAAAHTGIPYGVGVYGASKAGIEGLLRNLAVEIASDGVTVNTIALGIMDNVPDDIVPALARSVPAGRLGSPDDVGAATVYLASDEAAWVTGATLHLNGGAFVV